MHQPQSHESPGSLPAKVPQKCRRVRRKPRQRVSISMSSKQIETHDKPQSCNMLVLASMIEPRPNYCWLRQSAKNSKTHLWHWRGNGETTSKHHLQEQQAKHGNRVCNHDLSHCLLSSGPENDADSLLFTCLCTWRTAWCGTKGCRGNGDGSLSPANSCMLQLSADLSFPSSVLTQRLRQASQLASQRQRDELKREPGSQYPQQCLCFSGEATAYVSVEH